MKKLILFGLGIALLFCVNFPCFAADPDVSGKWYIQETGPLCTVDVLLQGPLVRFVAETDREAPPF